jgi:16S rRNA (guanine966-N2)-methyltransferase
MMAKYIRIVGGQYRRSRIEVPDLEGLRPTPDRVRETLFNWLAYFWNQQFSDKRVLDLFAGSGALGFEAASREVAHVQMVESDPRAVTALRKVRDRLGAKTVRIHAGTAAHALSRMQAARFDLVLLDPPFGKGWFPEILSEIKPLLEPNALVYAEAEQFFTPPDDYVALRQGRAAAVHYQLFQYSAPK